MIVVDERPFRHYNPETQCDGKRAYATKAEAKRVARRSERSLGQRLQAYRCPHCSTPESPTFHLGHKPAPWIHEEPAAS